MKYKRSKKPRGGSLKNNIVKGKNIIKENPLERRNKIIIIYKKTRAKRKRGGSKKKPVSFKSCKSDVDCWLSEPECDEKK